MFVWHNDELRAAGPSISPLRFARAAARDAMPLAQSDRKVGDWGIPFCSLRHLADAGVMLRVEGPAPDGDMAPLVSLKAIRRLAVKVILALQRSVAAKPGSAFTSLHHCW
jgi:hypothetical protein